MYVLLLVERDGGCDVFCTERRVAAADDVFEVGGRYFRGRDVEGEDFVCEVLEGQVFPRGRPVVGQTGYLFGDEQAAVGGETLQYDLFKGELWRVRASVAVKHAYLHHMSRLGCSGSAGRWCVKT
jgi:hypothetical protein